LLFVVVCVLAAGWFWQRSADTTEVLVAGQAVPAGHVLERADLTSAAVSGVSGALPASEAERVVGLTTAVGLVPGQVLTNEMLTTQGVPAAGQRLVGVELDATRVPAGLSPGDVVDVLVAPPSGDASNPTELNSPRALTRGATVHLVTTLDGGVTQLSLLIADRNANRVAAYGAAGRVAVVQSPAGGDD